MRHLEELLGPALEFLRDALALDMRFRVRSRAVSFFFLVLVSALLVSPPASAPVSPRGLLLGRLHFNSVARGLDNALLLLAPSAGRAARAP